MMTTVGFFGTGNKASRKPASWEPAGSLRDTALLSSGAFSYMMLVLAFKCNGWFHIR